MNLLRYPKYKGSGVQWLGEVPAHWAVAPLKRGFDVRLGKMLQTDQSGEDDVLAPYLRAANIQWGSVDTSDVKMMWFSPKDREQLALRLGDLLISEGGDVGRSALWRDEVEGCFIQNSVNRVRSTGGDLTAFLYYWMAAIKAAGYVDVLCNKSTIAHFTAEKVAGVPAPYPPETEQRSIVDFLDRETAKIDALLAEQEKLLALLAEKRQATISHAVTRGLNPDAPLKDSGIPWLGQVPAHWDVRRLRHAVPAVTVGIVVEPSKHYVDEGVPALRSLNVSPGQIRTENMVFISGESNELLGKSKLRSGDVVVVRSGQAGAAAVVPPELDGCNCIDLIIIRRPLAGCERFLCWYLASDAAIYQFEGGSEGAIQKHFNIGTAMNLVLSWPRAEEQSKIADYLDAKISEVDGLAGRALDAIALLKERRSALIAAAVTGQIDVRGAAEALAA